MKVTEKMLRRLIRESISTHARLNEAPDAMAGPDGGGGGDIVVKYVDKTDSSGYKYKKEGDDIFIVQSPKSKSHGAMINSAP